MPKKRLTIQYQVLHNPTEGGSVAVGFFVWALGRKKNALLAAAVVVVLVVLPSTSSSRLVFQTRFDGASPLPSPTIEMVQL